MNGKNNMKLPFKEKFCWATAMNAQNAVYAIISSFIMIAFTDFLLIPAITVSGIFLVSRIWDAINDIIMGVMADRTKTKWGKFRPYFLYVPIPLALFTILCFVNPGLGPTMTAVYAAVIYIIWGMLYTALDIPMYGIVAAMSNDSNERAKTFTLGRLFAVVGSLLPTIIIPAVADAVTPDDPAKGYLIAIIAISIVCVPLLMLGFWGTKERVKPIDTSKVAVSESFRRVFRLMKDSREVKIFILWGFINSTFLMFMAAAPYFAKYNLGDDNLVGIIMMAWLIPSAIGMIFSSLLIKWLGKKNVIIYSFIIRGAILAALFFVGYSNWIVFIAIYAIANIFFGTGAIAMPTILAEIVDYEEYKTGVRSDGVIFSIQTFMAKLSTAVSGVIIGGVLTIFNFVPNIAQTDATLGGIFALMTLISGIPSILAAIPFFFYRLDKAKVKEITAELAKRRAEQE